MFRGFDHDFMESLRSEQIVMTVMPLFAVPLQPQGRISVRDDSNHPAGAILRGVRAANRENFGFGLVFVAFAERASAEWLARSLGIPRLWSAGSLRRHD
jgi:hypothetical protein